jgi:hypothetical protein
LRSAIGWAVRTLIAQAKAELMACSSLSQDARGTIIYVLDMYMQIIDEHVEGDE